MLVARAQQHRLVVIVQVAVRDGDTCRRLGDVDEAIPTAVYVHVVDPDVAAPPDGDAVNYAVLSQTDRSLE